MKLLIILLFAGAVITFAVDVTRQVMAKATQVFDQPGAGTVA